MRHYALLTVLAAALQPALAQTPTQSAPTPGTVVGVGVPTLAKALGIQVEQRLSRHFSLGLWGARFFSADYPGYQGGLAARYYFRATAPTGWYLQAQVGAFTHDGQVVSDYPGASRQPSPTNIHGKGGSLGLGYQWALTPHLLLNAALGLRIYPYHWGGYLCDCHDVGNFNAIGQPGSALDGQLGVGYAF